MKNLSFNLKGHNFSLFHSRSIIVDSGTSFNLIPQQDLDILLKEFEKQLGFNFLYDIIPYTLCTVAESKKFPDLHFNIDGTIYTLPRESYILMEDGICALKIMTSSAIDIWILGLNFFENYYTIFDQENRRVGFAPSIHAQPRLSNMMLAAEEDEMENHNMRTIVISASIILVFIAVSGCFRNKNHSNEYTSIERSNTN